MVPLGDEMCVQEERRMKDFGYFGTGDEGYAQYMTAFDRMFNSADRDRELDEENFSDDDGGNTDDDF